MQIASGILSRILFVSVAQYTNTTAIFRRCSSDELPIPCIQNKQSQTKPTHTQKLNTTNRLLSASFLEPNPRLEKHTSPTGYLIAHNHTTYCSQVLTNECFPSPGCKLAPRTVANSACGKKKRVATVAFCNGQDITHTNVKSAPTDSTRSTYLTDKSTFNNKLEETK